MGILDELYAKRPILVRHIVCYDAFYIGRIARRVVMFAREKGWVNELDFQISGAQRIIKHGQEQVHPGPPQQRPETARREPTRR